MKPVPAILRFFLWSALILASGQAAAAQDCKTPPYCETRAYFTDWLAACRPSEPVYCSINAYVHNKAAPAGFDYQLRLARPGPDAPPELSLIAVERFAQTSREMIFDVPGQTNLVVAPEKVSTPEAVNDYLVDDPRILKALIPAMQKGYNLTVRFTDEDGDPASIRFSLMGFTAALAFIDDEMARAHAAGTQ